MMTSNPLTDHNFDRNIGEALSSVYPIKFEIKDDHIMLEFDERFPELQGTKVKHFRAFLDDTNTLNVKYEISENPKNISIAHLGLQNLMNNVNKDILQLEELIFRKIYKR